MLLSFTGLVEKYNIQSDGVLHVGASEGQEAKEYYDNGIEKVIWIEAIPQVFEKLKNNVSSYKENICINACISDTDGEILDFNVSNNGGQSSSLLEFGDHLSIHPSVKFIDKIKVETRRLDTIFKNIDLDDFNFLNLDLQGVELKALRGLGVLLNKFDYVYTEVNKASTYKDCVLIEQMDEYLNSFDFIRVETGSWIGNAWSDAFYIKKDKKAKLPILNQQVDVPFDFRPHHPFPYPPTNELIFEEWFYEHYNDIENPSDRIYLSVFWTSYQVKNKFGKDLKALDRLNRWLNNTLDRNKKYFVVVQYDDNILVDLSLWDVKVFGMCGKGVDYNLPLICMPHPYKFNTKKDILCSFIGRNTHPFRQDVFKLKGQDGFFISEENLPIEEYCSILHRSKYVLCPRGYSGTSFRIAESLQYGAMPIYISDEIIEPHGIDFTSYGMICEVSNLKELPSLLKSKKTPSPQKLKRIYDTYFTYKKNLEIIMNELSTE